MPDVLGGPDEGAVSWVEEQIIAGLLADRNAHRFEMLVALSGLLEARVEAGLEVLRVKGKAQNVLC